LSRRAAARKLGSYVVAAGLPCSGSTRRSHGAFLRSADATAMGVRLLTLSVALCCVCCAIGVQGRLRAGHFALQAPGGGHDVFGSVGVASADALTRDVDSLIPEVAAGGHTARGALARLLSLTSQPGAKTIMVASGLVSAAETLLKRPSTDSTTRRLAGSVLTVLTGAPGPEFF